MDRTICANESSRGRGVSASLRSTVLARSAVRGSARNQARGAAATAALVSAVCGGARCVFVSRKLSGPGVPRTPHGIPAPCPWARNVPARPPARNGCRAQGQDRPSSRGHGPPRATSQPFSRRERRLHPLRCRDPPPRGCRVPRPESPKPGVLLPHRGSSSCVTRDPAASGSAKPAPKRPRTAVRAVFRASGGDPPPWISRHPSAKGPTQGGSSSPRWSRPSSRLMVSRITSAGSSATTRLRSPVAHAMGFGGWSTSTPSAPVAGRKRRGQRGRSPPPAPPGDTRSVATVGRLACFP